MPFDSSMPIISGYGNLKINTCTSRIEALQFIEKHAMRGIEIKAAKPILKETEQLIIESLKNSNGLSIKKLAARINKAERTVPNHLVELINKDLVVEVGKGINDTKRKYYIKKQN